MCEDDRPLWCNTCNRRETHNMHITARDAVCMKCGTTIWGASNVRHARKKAELDYVTEQFQKHINGVFDELNKIANWSDVK